MLGRTFECYAGVYDSTGNARPSKCNTRVTFEHSICYITSNFLPIVQEIRIRRIVNIRVSLQDREERGEPDNFVEDEFGVMEDENLGFVLVSDTTLSKFGMDTMDSMVFKYLKSLREPGEGHRSNEEAGGASRHCHVTTANILESANRRNHKMSQELSKAVTQGANGIEVLDGILDELEVSARGILEAGAPHIAGRVFSMRLKLKALQSMLEDRNESMARTLVLNERAAFAEECQRQNEIAEQGSLGQLRAQIRSAIQAEEETEAMAMAVRLVNPGGPVSLSQRFSNLQDVVVPDQGIYDGDDELTVSLRDGMEPPLMFDDGVDEAVRRHPPPSGKRRRVEWMPR